MAVIFLLALAGNLYLENKEVREDQDAMKYAYGSFLSKKVKGQPLSARIHVGSLAVFQSDQGTVGCAIFR